MRSRWVQSTESKRRLQPRLGLCRTDRPLAGAYIGNRSTSENWGFMSNVMKVDANGAAEVVRAVQEFDWAWETGDIERFNALLGWRPDDFGNAATVFAITNFEVNHPDAWFELADGVVRESSFHATDLVDPSEQNFLVDGFAAVSKRVGEVLGAPTARTEGQQPGLRWELPGISIEVVQLAKSVTISRVNPKYQRMSDEARGI